MAISGISSLRICYNIDQKEDTDINVDGFQFTVDDLWADLAEARTMKLEEWDMWHIKACLDTIEGLLNYITIERNCTWRN